MARNQELDAVVEAARREAIAMYGPPHNWTADMQLEWYELSPGVRCRACDRYVIDPEPFRRIPTRYQDDAYRKRVADEEAEYERLHGECGRKPWNAAGSLTKHCPTCCPRPGLSPRQLETIAKALLPGREGAHMRALIALERRSPGTMKKRRLDRERLASEDPGGMTP